MMKIKSQGKPLHFTETKTETERQCRGMKQMLRKKTPKESKGPVLFHSLKFQKNLLFKLLCPDL